MTPTPTQTPTVTPSYVPPGVTPEPSLTPTHTYTPTPSLTYEESSFRDASVVFWGTVYGIDAPSERGDEIRVYVHEYYKGSGQQRVRISGFHPCGPVRPDTRYTTWVFYVHPQSPNGTEFHPIAVRDAAPPGVIGHPPEDATPGIGWLQTVALGFSTFSGALILAYMVRPRT